MGCKTHEIKFFFSLDTYPGASAKKEKVRRDKNLICLKDIIYIEKNCKCESQILKSQFPKSV